MTAATAWLELPRALRRNDHMTTEKEKRRTAADGVRDIAAVLDAKGKPCAPIRTTVTRATLLRGGIKPSKRGAPLMVGGHVVHCDGAVEGEGRLAAGGAV